MNELLLKIDDIQTAATEAEDAVYESLIESYDKMLTLMEHADDDANLAEFGIFQEAATDGSKTVRKTNIIAKLVRFIKQMCQRIIIKLSQFKLNRTAKAIVKRYNVPDNTPIIPVPSVNDTFWFFFKKPEESHQEFQELLDKIVDKKFVLDNIFSAQATELSWNTDRKFISSFESMKKCVVQLEKDLQDAKNGNLPDPHYFELVTKGKFLDIVATMQQSFDEEIKLAKKINAVIDTITHDDLDQHGYTHEVEEGMGEYTIPKEKMIRAIDKYVSDLYKSTILKIRFGTLYMQVASYVDHNAVSEMLKNPYSDEDFDDDDIMVEPGIEKTSDDTGQVSEDGLTTTVQNWIKEKDADKLRTIIITRLASDPQGKGVVQKITQRCGSWLYEPHEQNERHAHIYEKPINDMTRDDWNIIYGDLRNNFSLERFRLLCKLGAKLKLT